MWARNLEAGLPRPNQTDSDSRFVPLMVTDHGDSPCFKIHPQLFHYNSVIRPRYRLQATARHLLVLPSRLLHHSAPHLKDVLGEDQWNL